jgi:hypothetical protein
LRASRREKQRRVTDYGGRYTVFGYLLGASDSDET